MRILVTLATVLALASCGSMQESKKSAISEEAAIAKAAELPSVAIVRVPVGADGKEINDKAELRTTSAQNLTANTVTSAFAAAKTPEVTVDELDKTSSTESFCGWRRWRRCNSCGYGNTSYSYNYNSYNNYSNHNNYNWSFYSPAYYNYGYYYGYNYANTYNYAGYNYYQYNSSFGSSYSGQGYAPGYGAAY